MWRVVYKKDFEKDLKKLPKSVIKRAVSKIDELSLTGSSSSSKRLVGFEDYYRLRIGDYRLVYQKRASEIVLVMIGIRHRKDIYKKLKL